MAEIYEAVSTIKEQGNNEIVILRCASAYPAITDEMNLATMRNMKETFGVPVGLSDHSAGFVGAVTAVALGASVIEKHLCLSRDIDSADSAFSMEPKEFGDMVKAIRQAEKAIGTVQYGPSPQELGSVAKRRSVFVAKDIHKGEVFSKENIRVVRPADGIHPRFYDLVLGKTSTKDIKMGTPLSFDMIGGEKCDC